MKDCDHQQHMNNSNNTNSTLSQQERDLDKSKNYDINVRALPHVENAQELHRKAKEDDAFRVREHEQRHELVPEDKTDIA